MAFAEHERAILLAVKGVGPTVVLRLEQMGVEDLATLAGQDAAAAALPARIVLLNWDDLVPTDHAHPSEAQSITIWARFRAAMVTATGDATW